MSSGIKMNDAVPSRAECMLIGISQFVHGAKTNSVIYCGRKDTLCWRQFGYTREDAMSLKIGSGGQADLEIKCVRM
jgi:hypothetical protein